MEENFLPDVRMSLYGNSQPELDMNERRHKKSKKVKINEQSAHTSTCKSEKLKNRKATPYKIKKRPKKRHVLQNGNASLTSTNENRRTPTKKENPLRLSFNSADDTFSEEFKDKQLTPSKSELEKFQNTIRQSSSKRTFYDTTDSNSDDERQCREDFDLNAFFNACDVSELNESIIEPHAGINYEFISDYAKDVTILESESFCVDHVKNDNSFVENTESVKVAADDSEASEDENISIADKIEKFLSISDDSFNESSGSFLENEQSQEVLTACSAEYHDFIGNKLVILKENQSISFHGLLSLKIVHGKLEVLGSILDKNTDNVNLYSPRGAALLYIKNVTQDEEESGYLNISHFIQTVGNINEIFVETNSAIFLCKPLKDPKILFIEKHISQRIFPSHERGNEVQAVFEPNDTLNKLRTSSTWDDILNNVNAATKLMFAGGKGVGKSTLLRYSVNRLLNKFEKVRVLDLDPGQSEFAVPGCISIVDVIEPIFGPNFTHLKTPRRSYLSNINVTHDPKAYLKCMESLITYFNTLEDGCPTLINYMGFAQGIGLNIIASAIKLIQPTDIIQIHSKSRNKNFVVDLTYAAIEENCKFFSDLKTPVNCTKLNYKLHKVPAMSDANDGWKLEARLSREMCVLTYFGQMMRNGVSSLTSHKLPMYEIKLSEIKISNLYGEELSPAVVNANMVALCSLDEESNLFICLGYGVIRGIDLECDKLVLITPEEKVVLENVYYLVLGSVLLPPSVYMTPDDITGTIPYVMEGELVSLGQITKRSYLPANKK